MKALNSQGKPVAINENESKVFADICKGLCDHLDDQPFVSFDEIYVDGLSENQIKGYLSQLEKKGLVYESEDAVGNKVWQTFMTLGQIEKMKKNKCYTV